MSAIIQASSLEKLVPTASREQPKSGLPMFRTEAKAQALRDAGASHVIVTENEDVDQAVLKITDQRGARLIFDAVEGKAFSSLVAAAATEGIILVYGALSKEANTFSGHSSDSKEIDDQGNRFDGNTS